MYYAAQDLFFSFALRATAAPCDKQVALRLIWGGDQSHQSRGGHTQTHSQLILVLAYLYVLNKNQFLIVLLSVLVYTLVFLSPILSHIPIFKYLNHLTFNIFWGQQDENSFHQLYTYVYHVSHHSPVQTWSR